MYAKGQTIEIDGIKYVIEVAHTAEDMRASGLRNVAALMDEMKVSQQLGMRRPRGKKCYVAQVFENGYKRIIFGV